MSVLFYIITIYFTKEKREIFDLTERRHSSILGAMIFFKKKKKEVSPPPSPPKVAAAAKKKEKPVKEKPLEKQHSLQEFAHDRVLTAEGWRRQMMLQFDKPKKG